MRIRFRENPKNYNQTIFLGNSFADFYDEKDIIGIINRFVRKNDNDLYFLKQLVYSQEEKYIEEVYKNIKFIEDFYKYFVVEEQVYIEKKKCLE